MDVNLEREVNVQDINGLKISYIKNKPYERRESKIAETLKYADFKKDYQVGMQGIGKKLMFRVFEHNGKIRALCNTILLKENAEKQLVIDETAENFAVGASPNLVEKLQKLEPISRTDRSFTVAINPSDVLVYIMEGEEVDGEMTHYFRIGTPAMETGVA